MWYSGCQLSIRRWSIVWSLDFLRVSILGVSIRRHDFVVMDGWRERGKKGGETSEARR